MIPNYLTRALKSSTIKSHRLGWKVPQKVGRKEKTPLGRKRAVAQKGPSSTPAVPLQFFSIPPGISQQPMHFFLQLQRLGFTHRRPRPFDFCFRGSTAHPLCRKLGWTLPHTSSCLWQFFSCFQLFSQLQSLEIEHQLRKKIPVLHNLMLQVLSGGLPSLLRMWLLYLDTSGKPETRSVRF